MIRSNIIQNNKVDYENKISLVQTENIELKVRIELREVKIESKEDKN